MLLDGKKVASDLQKKLQEKIDLLKERKPQLTVILVGDNPASHTYVAMKKKNCCS